MAWVRLIAGLWLFAAGVVLGLRSGLGVGPWDVLHDGIRKVTPLSFGTGTILVGVLLVAVAAVAGVRPGPGTLVNMVAIGAFADAMLATGIGRDLDAQWLPVRLAAVVAGVGLVALGSALYIGAGLGSGPRDSLMLMLSARTGLRIGVVRALIEATVLGIGVLLGGAAGIGTVLFAFGIGPAVEATFRLLRVQPRLEPGRAGAGAEAAVHQVGEDRSGRDSCDPRSGSAVGTAPARKRRRPARPGPRPVAAAGDVRSMNGPAG